MNMLLCYAASSLILATGSWPSSSEIMLHMVYGQHSKYKKAHGDYATAFSKGETKDNAWDITYLYGYTARMISYSC
jgi:hypothetical protein